MPALLALNAQVTLRCGDLTRQLPLDQFYLAYQRKDLQRGEFVVSVSIPVPRPGQKVAGYKVSKRFEQDIAAVSAGFSIEIEAQRITGARIAFGGMAATPKRAAQTEAALIGRTWDAVTVEAAVSALDRDFQPLTDMRASADYRKLVAANLLRRFHLCDRGSSEPLRLRDVPCPIGLPQ
jgi:xanthine dehydrogenase small subunit